MSPRIHLTLLVTAAAALLCPGRSALADSHTFFDAVTGGKPYITLNSRYEGVEQDNALEDASAMTLLTRFGYRTGDWGGWSAHVEFEDSRIILGADEFSVPPTGFNTGEYSVIADPETTELDQAYVQYANSTFKARVGRQIIAYEGQRFVGAVPWRQDWQTFDAVHFEYSGIENLTVKAGQIFQRNRIFADERDLDSNDTLLDLNYKTPLGTLGGYAYLLEVDDIGRNALDTLGVRFGGGRTVGDGEGTVNKILYKAEYATQDVKTATGDFDVDYLAAEIGLGISRVTVKAGYEALGSDDGNIGFATPLATLHKFNGWADLFLATPAAGLEDVYVSLGGKVEKFKYAVNYHDFSTDVSTAAGSDLGSEVDVLVTRPIGDHLTFGFKLAMYDAGDPGLGPIDTDRIWTWITARF